jgi:beta-lactamase regulating signal transducer with metallopeptidase domain
VSVHDVLRHPVAAALGWSLLHSLWQLTLVAGLLASVNVLLRRRSAQARYLAATGGLVLTVLLPAGTFAIAARAGAGPTLAVVPAVRAAAFLEDGEPVSGERDTAVAPAIEVASAPRPRSGSATSPAALRLRERLDAALPALVLAWAAGVSLLSVRVLGGWALAQRLKRSGRPVTLEVWPEAIGRLCDRMRIRVPVRLCQSALVEVPTVIGWLRPVVLLPLSTLAGLSPAQLEALLAHELAHVRRFDYLVNLVQTCGETLLFYHPAVWWVSHRMRVEREHCCDDAAVGVCGDALGYARALAELEGLRSMTPTLAVAANAGSLWRRIARLLGTPPPHLSRSSRWLAGLLALGTLGALGLSAAASLEGGTPLRLDEPAFVRPVLADYGVTKDYVRGLASLGYEDLSEGKLIALRSHGVSVSFVEELKDLGYEHLSVSRLIMLRSQGVTPDYVQGLQELGYEGLSPLSLVALRSQGVTSSYVEELKDLGYEGLSVPLLIGLRSHGVDPGFIGGLQEEGYEGLAPGELVELRQSGVTSSYVNRLKAAGYEDLTVAQLVALRQSGVEPKAQALKDEGEDGDDEADDAGDDQDHDRDKPCPDKERHSREEEP